MMVKLISRIGNALVVAAMLVGGLGIRSVEAQGPIGEPPARESGVNPVVDGPVDLSGQEIPANAGGMTDTGYRPGGGAPVVNPLLLPQYAQALANGPVTDGPRQGVTVSDGDVPELPQAACPGFTVQTSASVIYSTDTTLNANTVYHYTGNVFVAQGATLTIPATTKLKFAANTYLQVDGGLVLQSAGQDSPVFTAITDDALDAGCDSNNDGLATTPIPGYWWGIYLMGGATISGGGVLRYSTDGLSLWQDDTVAFSPTLANWNLSQNKIGMSIYMTADSNADVGATIQNNVFNNNFDSLAVFPSTPGAVVTRTANITVANNQFTNQARFPIYLLTNSYPTFSNNTFSGAGGFRAIGVGGNWNRSGTLATVNGGAWSGGNNLPYVVYTYRLPNTLPTAGGRVTTTNVNRADHWIIRGASTTVTVPNNTVIKLAGHVNQPVGGSATVYQNYIDVYGRLALGTNVTFTSFWDDAYGGDANGDLATTQAMPGDWAAVYIEQGDTVTTGTQTTNLAGGRVRYGLYGWALYNTGGGLMTTTVSNSSFDFNAYSGVYLYNTSTGDVRPTITNNTFTGTLGQTYSGLTAYNDSPFASTAISPTVSGNTFTAFTSTVSLQVMDGLSAGDFSNNTFQNSVNGVELILAVFGQGAGGIVGDGSASPILRNNTFRNNVTGLRTTNQILINNNIIYGSGRGDARPQLINNTFQNHSGYPIYLDGGGYPTYQGNTFTGSYYDAIAMSGFFNGRNNAVWPQVPGDTEAGSAPFVYVITDEVRVGSEYAWWDQYILPADRPRIGFEPGAVIKFRASEFFKTWYMLDLSGTAGQPITITAWEDDSAGGDTNRDGSSTQPQTKSWLAMYLMGPKANGYHHLNVRYGRFGLHLEDYFTFDATCPTLANINFSNNGYGLVILNWRNRVYPSCASVSASTFSNNQVGAAFGTNWAGNVTSIVENNAFTNNDYHFLTFHRDYTYPSGLNAVWAPGSGLTDFDLPDQVSVEVMQRSSNDPEIGPATGVAAPVIRNNTFTGGMFAGYLAGNGFPTYSGNTFSGMTHRAIRLGGLYSNSDPANRDGWVIEKVRPTSNSTAVLAYTVTEDPRPCRRPWFASSTNCVGRHLVINPGAVVNVDAGNVLKFDTDLYADIYGELYSQGSDGNLVTFTSYKDDGAAGDSNADGSASAPQRGDWAGIYLEASGIRADYVFHYNLVKYSQYGISVFNYWASNINIFPVVRHNIVTENEFGMSFYVSTAGNIIDRVENTGATTPLVEGNRFFNNDKHLFVGAPQSTGRVNVTITGNCLLPSASVGLENASASNTIRAANNWWGNPGGPNASMPLVGSATTSPALTSQPTFCSASLAGINGRVFRTGDTPQAPNPLAGAVLVISGNGISAVSDSSGFFSLSGLNPGRYTIRPYASGYRFQPAEITVDLVTSVSGVEFEAFAVAGSNLTITGGVFDAAGAGQGNVIVTAVAQGSGVTAMSTTNGSGSYVLSNLPAGTYTLSVANRAGYTDRTVTIGPSASGQDFRPGAGGGSLRVYLPHIRK